MSLKQSSITLNNSNLKIEFTNKQMTAYGGFSLISQYFHNIQFEKFANALFPIEETSNNRLNFHEKLIGYLLLVLAGGNRFSHTLYLGNLSVLSSLFDEKRLPKSGSCLTRFFNKFKRRKVSNEISTRIWNYLSQLIPFDQIKQDYLSFDSSVLSRYGKQEGAKKGYNPKKPGRPSHHPLLAFLNQSHYVVDIWNRSGNTASSSNICSFFDSAVQRLQGKLEIKGVLADSGFYILRFLKHMEDLGFHYIIRTPFYLTIQQAIYRQKEWKRIYPGVEIGEFEFQHPKWEEVESGKLRRYIVVREDITKRENPTGKQLKLFKDKTIQYRYLCFVTSSDEEPEKVWELIRGRCADENVIKELKEDFALGGFCLKSFYATEVAMNIRCLLYNLLLLFRRLFLPSKEKSKRLKSMRYKYFIIPSQMGSNAKCKILRLSIASQKIRSKMIYLFEQINQYNPAIETYCNAIET